MNHYWFLREDRRTLDKIEKDLKQKFGIQLQWPLKDYEKYKEIYKTLENKIWGEVEEESAQPASIKGLLPKLRIIENCFKDVDITIYMVWGEKNADPMDKKTEAIIMSTLDRDNMRALSDAIKYFPFKVLENERTSWCNKYQGVLFYKDNMGIFSIDEYSDDLSKYCYFKTEKIFEKLKNESIENLWILEMSLGIVLTNTIYMYLKEVKTLDELQEYKNIIRKLCQIPGGVQRIILLKYCLPD